VPGIEWVFHRAGGLQRDTGSMSERCGVAPLPGEIEHGARIPEVGRSPGEAPAGITFEMYSRGTGVAGVDGAAGERERGIGDGISHSAIEEGDRDRRKPEAATLFVRREGKGAGKRHGDVKQ